MRCFRGLSAVLLLQVGVSRQTFLKEAWRYHARRHSDPSVCTWLLRIISCFYYGKNFILAIFYNSPNRQIKILAKFSCYTVCTIMSTLLLQVHIIHQTTFYSHYMVHVFQPVVSYNGSCTGWLVSFYGNAN